MTTKRGVRGWTATMVLASFAGAGGGCDDDGAAAFQTSVDSGQLLALLSVSDQGQLCSDTARFAEEQIMNHRVQELLCRSFAVQAVANSSLVEEQLEPACSRAHASCMVLQIVPTLARTVCGLGGLDCNATVATYGACLGDFFAWAIELLGSFPRCEDVTLARLNQTKERLRSAAIPSSCQVLEQTCRDNALTSGLRDLFGMAVGLARLQGRGPRNQPRPFSTWPAPMDATRSCGSEVGLP